MDEQIVDQPLEIKGNFPKNKFVKLGLVLGGILLVILVFVLGFYIGSSKQAPLGRVQVVPTPTSSVKVTSTPTTIEGIEWETYDGPVYKFKYPKSWHVYVSPGTDYDPQGEINTANIIISSVPIFGGPGVEAKAVFVRDQSRNPNSTKPDLDFNDFLNKERKSWKNFKESSFENDGLKFIKFEGERMWMGDYSKMVTYYFSYEETVGGSNKIIKHIGTVEILGCQDLTSQECKVKDEIIKSLRRIL